jgi:hypothetical protein
MSSNHWLRRAGLLLSSLFPDHVLLRQLQQSPLACHPLELKNPVELENEQTRKEEMSWEVVEAATNKDDVGYLHTLLGLCRDLAELEVDMQSERTRSDLMRKIGRTVRHLPRGSWAAVMAVRLLVGQLAVKLSTLGNQL